MCILNTQQTMEMSKIHFASLKAEQVYYLPSDIVVRCIQLKNFNKFIIWNHGGGEFLYLKIKKPFDIQDYKMFIPYLDLKKLASHPYVPIKLKHCSIWPNFRYLPRFTMENIGGYG
ncbi:hypothetical protein Ahy_A03g011556 [Arachis hypogaea]|uniref:Uncharacterized protein n=1 Tax=Arachis hypogaea TaxID=3818 RepID=A0A445DR36_ARAHY|nr:hypothetical protein Ahy_A03g011556 [Arachis hypogaea]